MLFRSNASKNQLILNVSGRAGQHYELAVWNPAQVSSVEGGTLSRTGKLEIQMPQGAADSYVPQKVTLRFVR